MGMEVGEAEIVYLSLWCHTRLLPFWYTLCVHHAVIDQFVAFIQRHAHSSGLLVHAGLFPCFLNPPLIVLFKVMRIHLVFWCLLGYVSVFINPPNSCMDHRIFNMHRQSFYT